MKLLIVESPSKAKTIEKYLGKEYSVRASVGHVRDLPKNNKKAINIEDGFVPFYEIVPGKEKIVRDIGALAKKAKETILATDPDREGEAIAWHLKEALDLKKAKRITFHEITKEAVEEALKAPRDIDENLKTAQEARRVLDRLFGYDLSALIWKKVRYGLSAGRVQSPALRIIMEKEREIRAFKPEKYWVVTASVKTKNGEAFEMVASENPKSAEEAEDLVKKAEKAEWPVLKVEETDARRAPRAPFTTSTLQQSASSRLGFSPAKTMSVAQKLYEAGLITYMRTDSVNLSAGALEHIKQIVISKFGADLAETRKYTTRVKNAQEAHEAVRPTDFGKMSAGNTTEQRKLYELIWRRTVSSQMADAKIKRTKITSEPVPAKIFEATGSRTIFDGWLLADTASKGEEKELPKLSAGDMLSLTQISSVGKETEPPGRYTEAGLVKELEKRGIGRPSTYASTIKTLGDRNYVTKEGRALRPTDTGEVVSEFLEKNFGNYISDSFTAEMENELDEIAEGKREYVKTLKSFYSPFRKEVLAKDKLEKITNLGEAGDEHKCPVCGGGMIIKLGRNGKFLSCAKYPECAGARTIDGKELAGPKETGENCPQCKDGKLILREGRFGEFVSCNRYPKCKYIKKDAVPQKTTGVKCPLCQKGEMTEKRGRFGVFYGCSSYPECKNIIKSKPTGALCPMCQSLMMEGTKTIPERCSNKSCPNHNPHKKE